MNAVNIWMIASKQEGFLFPKLDDKVESWLFDNWGSPLAEQWSCANLKFLSDDGREIPDFYFIGGFIPVVSESALSAIDLDHADVELLPAQDDCGKKFYILNPLSCEDSALNLKKSKVQYTSDGTISWISDFVFSYCPQKRMFRLSEMPTKMFVDDKFVQLIREKNMTGIDFIPCKVTGPSLFERLFHLSCLLFVPFVAIALSGCTSKPPVIPENVAPIESVEPVDGKVGIQGVERAEDFNYRSENSAMQEPMADENAQIGEALKKAYSKQDSLKQ
ncbi:MAG: hypothetical protein MJZ25_12175 [Fibrobacter sp.]|nr:hypothetical protein [Fibrobacter sp.]